jgi:hypothetical protein
MNKRVLDNDEDLEARFYTNDNLDVGHDVKYLIKIQQKELVLYTKEIDFRRKKNYKLNIKADDF